VAHRWEDQDDLINCGLIALNQAEAPTGPRTLLVSGVARSGTSMLANVLLIAGVSMGRTADGVVFEDVELAQALEEDDRSRLRTLVRARNAAHAVWGFKRPNLHRHAVGQQLSEFRAPVLLLTFRDLVAIARRNIVSNKSLVAESLRHAAADLSAMADYALRAGVPTLLVSYEKAIAAPRRLVEAVSDFVGLQPDERTAARMAAAVAADNPTYRQVARVHLNGFVDRAFDGRLYGWCAVAGRPEAVPLELLLDGQVSASFYADLYREDLREKAGIGTGHHGFELDVSGLPVTEDTVVTIRVRDHDFVLTHSGRPLRQLRDEGGQGAAHE
jgi:hypothetical protein